MRRFSSNLEVESRLHLDQPLNVVERFATGRTDHSAVLLGNGDAMVVGGYDGSGGNIGYLSSAERFH
jgi:hypothetical protein